MESDGARLYLFFQHHLLFLIDQFHTDVLKRLKQNRSKSIVKMESLDMDPVLDQAKT